MRKIIYCLVALIFVVNLTQAQENDSIKTKRLNEVIVRSQKVYDVERLPATQSTYLWVGKKNEVISVEKVDANVAEKTPRQIFAKVPGVFVYDMDGSGNQMNISTRGLDAHRGWEFNIRKNGVITNSDMYAYPASHYSMPMETIETIQLVRGTGSLQYGAQFGGMLNYVAKRADTTRAFSFESINTAGSFGLLSTYNAIGGKVGKFEYYTYFSKRVSEGYRKSSRSDYDAQSFVLAYYPTKNIKLKAEVVRSNYVYQIPGPLSDSMFHADPRQATRSRNYFNPEIYVPSLSLDWKIGTSTHLSWTTSAVLGVRSSVMLDKQANVIDAIDPATLQYAPRQVDVDHFNSYTSELRLLHQYTLFHLQSTFVGGLQLMNNDTHRQQLGKGTTGTDFDLTLTQPGFGRDLHFKTKNVALFIENNFRLTEKLSVSPGVRIEIGRSDMDGNINSYDYEPGEIATTIKHKFPLLGINAEYALKENHSFYGGWSQSYRPVVFKDIIPGSIYERTDKNLKDAYGYNMEVGYRGATKSFRWDVTTFQLQYNNRLGTLVQPDNIIYRTNIGNSVTRGLEIFGEYSIGLHDVAVSVFTSTSFFDARYRNAHVRSGTDNKNISGNKVESVPDFITRNGIRFKYRVASLSVLYSYTGESYADALNTKVPTPKTGAVGRVPSYGILDINTSFRIFTNLTVRFNINNVTNKQYFTKRPQFYPGPGVWSSDGRSCNVTIGLKI